MAPWPGELSMVTWPPQGTGVVFHGVEAKAGGDAAAGLGELQKAALKLSAVLLLTVAHVL